MELGKSRTNLSPNKNTSLNMSLDDLKSLRAVNLTSLLNQPSVVF